MITTLLVDDEDHNRNVLRLLLEKHYPNLQIVAEAASADDAFLKIGEHKPALIFLDVKMPQKNGFDLLKMFTAINFEVIFVTAYDNYAIRAFEFNALGYVLKPINTSKLLKTVEKAVQKINANISGESILQLVNTISNTEYTLNRFSVHHNDKVIFVNIPDIMVIEAKEDNTTIQLLDNTRYYSSKNLAKYEDALGENDLFIRINKSTIINTNFLKNYSKGELCIIEMKNGQTFEVSRRRKSEILKRLK
jgi:two-component system LytT family response regulator